ncbi:hypothetical protein HXX01_02650 [Candidatus Nomurabacteria bacterium]|nr:hypothetical protein [Candidatus Nomurabacteria bacterium]
MHILTDKYIFGFTQLIKGDDAVPFFILSQDQKIEKAIQHLESRRKFLESQLINNDTDFLEDRN